MNEYINKNALAEKIVVKEALIKEERNADYENMEIYNGMIRGLVEAQRLMLETDTIEIVRCKDCKYFGYDYEYKHPCCARVFYHPRVSDNDYCSYAEWRKNE